MALFGLFGKQDVAVQAKKLVAKATQKYGPAENRQEALEKLRDLAAPEGWAGLLQRFTIRVDPQVTDQDEKQFCCDCLGDAGLPAVPVIKEFIEKSDQPTWAIQALEKIIDDDAIVEIILDALDRVGPDYVRDPEKKITLVRRLDDFEDARIAPRLLPYFEDPSEDVRFNAVEVATKTPVEGVKEPLIAALLKAHAEKSERMKLVAAKALVKTGFSVKGQTPAVVAALPAGFSVDKEGVVRSK